MDTNLLVYAHRADSEFHVSAARCLRELSQERSPWAIPWPCVHEFFAIATHPRVYAPPTPVPKALEQIDAWMQSPSLVLLGEAAHHWTDVKTLIRTGKIAGPAVHDARIATICITHGVRELWSADRDFGRFPRLKVVNPLLN